MPPKVAFMLNSPTIGGAELYLADVIQRTPESVAVLRPNSPSYDLLSKHASSVLDHDMGDCLDKWRGLNGFAPLRFITNRRIASVLETLKEQNVLILHLQMYKEQIFATPAAHSLGIPVVWTQHCHAPWWLQNTTLGRRYRDVANKYASKVIAVSESIKEDLVRLGINKDKIQTIVNGVDLQRFSPSNNNSVRAELNIEEDALVIGSIGRLHRLKGQKLLIESLEHVFRKHPNACCLIVGGGWRQAEYQALCKRLGIAERVRFCGFTENVVPYLHAIDVYVCPSLMEAFGLNITEAMACRKPVVATAVGGIMEQITDGENGVLVPPANREALARAIKSLLDDPERACRLGKNARLTCERRFNRETMLSETIDLFDKVAAEAK